MALPIAMIVVGKQFESSILFFLIEENQFTNLIKIKRRSTQRSMHNTVVHSNLDDCFRGHLDSSPAHLARRSHNQRFLVSSLYFFLTISIYSISICVLIFKAKEIYLLASELAAVA